MLRSIRVAWVAAGRGQKAAGLIRWLRGVDDEIVGQISRLVEGDHGCLGDIGHRQSTQPDQNAYPPEILLRHCSALANSFDVFALPSAIH